MTRAPRKAAGPANQSRGAGAPAPASAAATAPRPPASVAPPPAAAPPAAAAPFFNPDPVETTGPGQAVVQPAEPVVQRPPRSGLMADFDAAPDSQREPTPEHRFNGDVARQSLPASHGSTVDQSLAQAVEGVAEEEETLEQTIARIRAMGIRPIGRQGGKLAHPPIPGYHLHWFNDEGARVEDAKLAGWAHVKDTRGAVLKRAVGTGRDKGVLFAFLMKIPLVFWQEELAARHAEADERMDATKHQLAVLKPGDKAQAADKGKFYDPTESGTPISIRKG